VSSYSNWSVLTRRDPGTATVEGVCGDTLVSRTRTANIPTASLDGELRCFTSNAVYNTFGRC